VVQARMNNINSTAVRPEDSFRGYSRLGFSLRMSGDHSPMP
jgi:hypothetical protein